MADDHNDNVIDNYFNSEGEVGVSSLLDPQICNVGRTFYLDLGSLDALTAEYQKQLKL